MARAGEETLEFQRIYRHCVEHGMEEPIGRKRLETVRTE